jgi:small multidrug resistance family-3 protein
MRALLLFVVAGLLEIGGGYLVWLWLRLDRSFAFGLAGFVALALYGVIPCYQSQSFGRVYAAYGAVFVVLSVLWGWQVEQQRPDARDLIGAAICVAGALVILWPRAGG